MRVFSELHELAVGMVESITYCVCKIEGSACAEGV
jgi:hypothetical protein